MSGYRRSRRRPSAMPVRPITSTALSFRSLRNLNGPPDFRQTDSSEARLAGLSHCCGRPWQNPATRWRSLPSCLAFRAVTRSAIARCRRLQKKVASLPDISRTARGARGRRPGAHGAGRCALARSDIAGALRSDRRSPSAPAGAPCRRRSGRSSLRRGSAFLT